MVDVSKDMCTFLAPPYSLITNRNGDADFTRSFAVEFVKYCVWRVSKGGNQCNVVDFNADDDTPDGGTRRNTFIDNNGGRERLFAGTNYEMDLTPGDWLPTNELIRQVRRSVIRCAIHGKSQEDEGKFKESIALLCIAENIHVPAQDQQNNQQNNTAGRRGVLQATWRFLRSLRKTLDEILADRFFNCLASCEASTDCWNKRAVPRWLPAQKKKAQWIADIARTPWDERQQAKADDYRWRAWLVECFCTPFRFALSPLGTWWWFSRISEHPEYLPDEVVWYRALWWALVANLVPFACSAFLWWLVLRKA